MPESQNLDEPTPTENNALQSMDVDPAEVDKSPKHGSQLEEISRLLREGLDSETVEAVDEDTEQGDLFATDETGKVKLNKVPDTLAELAEATGVELEDLYKLAVPDGSEEGKTYTLGELKDAATKVNGVELRELQIEEHLNERESQITRMQSEIQDLYNLIPDKFKTPELIEKIGSRQQQKLTRERQLALTAIPEWKDETTRNVELEGIVEHLKDYGLPSNYLANVADHRLFKYFRENWKRAERVKKTLAMVNEKFPKPATSQPTPKGKTKSTERAPLGNAKTSSQVRQISNLLRNGE